MSDEIPTSDKRIIDEFLSKYSGGKQRIEDVFKDAEDESKFITNLVQFVISELIKHNLDKFKRSKEQGRPVGATGQMCINSAYMTIFVEQFTHEWNTLMSSALGKMKIEMMKQRMKHDYFRKDDL